MTAEKYVKIITSKIPCDRKRKEDIAMQLLSEIEERRAQGEAVEKIIEEMGSAHEVAESFLENISPDERRKYRRKKHLLIAAIVVSIAILLGGVLYWFLPKGAALEADGIFVRSKVEQQTADVIALLSMENYDALSKLAAPQMKPYLNKEYMDTAKSQIDNAFGSMLSIGEIYAQQIRRQGQVFAICQVNVSYENVAVTYTITFDSDMRLAGLYMR